MNRFVGLRESLLKRRLLLPVLALGGAAAWRTFAARRNRIVYPAPESLIIEPDADSAGGDRFIALEGAANVRDIGGYATSDGRQVRRGRVYRSGTLAEITGNDQRTLQTLGLKLICDLRNNSEVTKAPDRLPVGITYTRIPVNADPKDEQQFRLRTLLFHKRRFSAVVAELYRRMIDDHAPVFGQVFRRLADSDSLPALVHCTAGKDRAGLTTALLLLALGVPEAVVIADYSLSNRYYDHFRRYVPLKRLRLLGVTVEDMQPFLVANPQILRDSLRYLAERYGSVLDYLRQQAGVDDETLERLKANLLL